MNKKFLGAALAAALFFLTPGLFAQNIKARFEGGTGLSYAVYFNGFSSGHIRWSYIGVKEIEGVAVDVLRLDSDTKILWFLDLTSKETIFLDRKTHLPVKVMREVVLSKKEELIEELYNQNEGYVEIVRSKEGAARSSGVLRQDKPIQNILALLYFFPADINLEERAVLTFNLPTRKVQIETMGPRQLKIAGETREVYFLAGKSGRRFNLWLDKELKTPIRLDFLFPVGKVSIIKENL